MRPGRQLLLLLACAGCSAPAGNEPAGAPWLFEVTLDPNGEELAVQAMLPAGPQLDLDVAPATAARFLGDIEVTENGTTRARSLVDGGLHLDAAESSRRLRWRFRARAAAEAIDDIDAAAWRGQGFVGSLGAFLLHPGDDAAGRVFDLHVAAPPYLTFACGCNPTADGWRGRVEDLAILPACTFGAVARRTLTIDGAANRPRIDVVELGERPARYAEALDEWVTDAAHAVAQYFGTFPVDHLLLVIVASRRPGISGGTARGMGGARIVVDVPPRQRQEQFRRDWVLFHEMIHLGMPSLPMAQHWLEEGSATYIEPLLQARAGRKTEVAVWTEFLSDYAQGLAGAGGLDDDHSWARTYYGGATFCLLADVEIRARTDNRKSLQDVMRAVLTGRGNITQTARIEELLSTGDRATGTTVLTELYARMGQRVAPRELDSLWRRLGVRLENGRTVFDEDAELASVRRALVLGTR